MGATPRDHREPDAITLLTETVDDAKDLLGQQIELLRSELRQELGRAGAAGVSLTAGAGLAAAGGMLSSLMLIHGIHRATGLPLWGCYGLVGGLLGVAGLGLLARGYRQAGDIRLLPQSAEALRENVSWLKEQASQVTT